MGTQDWTEPNVCIDEHLTVDDGGDLQLQPWSVPRIVADVKSLSGGDGALLAQTELPGKLLIDLKARWRNDTPIEHWIDIRIIRAYRSWIVSNPNAIQFRDRWTYTIDEQDITPSMPLTTSIFDGQCGSAIDLGTNSVAEPLPGVEWVWASANMRDEIVGPVEPGEVINVWYRCYVWTPPPFSDNANKNSPIHQAYARWARVQLLGLPTQGTLVTGARVR